MTFVKDISNFVKKAKEKHEAFVVEVVNDMMEDIVDGTPVDTGLAKSSWFTGINQVETRKPSQTGTGPRGAAKFSDFERIKAENTAAILRYRPGDTIYLANSAPYIDALEFNRLPKDYKYKKYTSSNPYWIRKIIDKADDYAANALRKVTK
jgi:hypothetical protein